jgi:hypothetical protein
MLMSIGDLDGVATAFREAAAADRLGGGG